MADNYTQFTVTPFFPAHALSEFALAVLREGHGISRDRFKDEDGNDMLYFYCSDGYHEDCDATEFVTKEALEEALLNNDPVANEIAKGNGYISFPWVVQQALKASNLSEAMVEGAYTCSKMRPGQFGGFVWRITQTTAQCVGTDMLQQWLRDNPEQFEAKV